MARLRWSSVRDALQRVDVLGSQGALEERGNGAGIRLLNTQIELRRNRAEAQSKITAPQCALAFGTTFGATKFDS